jgi:hypothetical protein
MENGLGAISKKFDKIEKIYLLEFIEEDNKLLVIGTSSDSEEEKLKLIIWNMYNVGEIETTMELDNFLTVNNLATRLARTSGNLLQVDNEGNVTSILKRADNKLLEQEVKVNTELSDSDIKRLKVVEPNGGHILHYNEYMHPNFKPIAVVREPWVLDDYERNSYCLYQNKNESEIETLQLIIGRSTIQIWHQIASNNKNKSKDELPNKGEPFLEYIWTNGIPVNQERKKTRLRIEKFEYGSNDDGKLNDFYLKVYWYERVSKDVGEDEREIKKDDIDIDKMEKDREPEMKKEENEEDRELRTEMEKDRQVIEMEKDREEKKNQVERRVKEIRKQDILDKVNAVRRACKALEFINKRTKYLVNYTKKHLVSVYCYILTNVL